MPSSVVRPFVFALTGVLAAGVLLVASPPVAASEQLAWTTCSEPSLRDGGFDCARLSVPMDRRDAARGSFSLSIVRHPSTGDPQQRIGSLVFNPGGPGGSGLDSIATVWSVVPDIVKQRFDLVTWDPRGINESTPALEDCAMPYPARPITGPVDWAQVARDFRRDLGRANRACQARNAAFAQYMGTNENVQDLDRIRAALGDDQLTYWGMSYGTRIGYVYALTFPDRVRGLVLDGSIDPAGTLLGLAQGGAAPDQAFGVFADAHPGAGEQLTRSLNALDTATIPLPDGTQLDRWSVLDFVFSFVAQQSAYPTLAKFVESVHTTTVGTGDEQAKAAKETALMLTWFRRMPNSNAGGVFSVVNCLDYAGRPTLPQAIDAIRYQVRLAPLYGGSLATPFALGCAGLSLTPDPVPVITGEGPRVPTLILGASRDGSTIVQWTARMSRAFPASRTVTYAGGQHVTWMLAGSDCVNRAANTFVTSLRLPAMDVGCRNALG